jgi:hypothetical protein
VAEQLGEFLHKNRVSRPGDTEKEIQQSLGFNLRFACFRRPKCNEEMASFLAIQRPFFWALKLNLGQDLLLLRRKPALLPPERATRRRGEWPKWAFYLFADYSRLWLFSCLNRRIDKSLVGLGARLRSCKRNEATANIIRNIVVERAAFDSFDPSFG